MTGEGWGVCVCGVGGGAGGHNLILTNNARLRGLATPDRFFAILRDSCVDGRQVLKEYMKIQKKKYNKTYYSYFDDRLSSKALLFGFRSGKTLDVINGNQFLIILMH